MSQTVNLSDGLVLAARLASEFSDRSIAGQIEFWVQLGRTVELALQEEQFRAGAVKPLSACLESASSREAIPPVARCHLTRP